MSSGVKSFVKAAFKRLNNYLTGIKRLYYADDVLIFELWRIVSILDLTTIFVFKLLRDIFVGYFLILETSFNLVIILYIVMMVNMDEGCTTEDRMQQHEAFHVFIK